MSSFVNFHISEFLVIIVVTKMTQFDANVHQILLNIYLNFKFGVCVCFGSKNSMLGSNFHNFHFVTSLVPEETGINKIISL